MKKIGKVLLGAAALAAVFGIVKVVVDEVKNKDLGDDWDDMNDEFEDKFDEDENLEPVKDVEKHYVKITPETTEAEEKAVEKEVSDASEEVKEEE